MIKLMDYSKNIDDSAISSLFCVKMIGGKGYIQFMLVNHLYQFIGLRLQKMYSLISSHHISKNALITSQTEESGVNIGCLIINSHTVKNRRIVLPYATKYPMQTKTIVVATKILFKRLVKKFFTNKI